MRVRCALIRVVAAAFVVASVATSVASPGAPPDDLLWEAVAERAVYSGVGVNLSVSPAAGDAPLLIVQDTRDPGVIAVSFDRLEGQYFRADETSVMVGESVDNFPDSIGLGDEEALPPVPVTAGPGRLTFRGSSEWFPIFVAVEAAAGSAPSVACPATRLNVTAPTEEKIESIHVRGEQHSLEYVYRRDLHDPHVNVDVESGLARIRGDLVLFVWGTLAEVDDGQSFPTGKFVLGQTGPIATLRSAALRVTLTNATFEAHVVGDAQGTVTLITGGVSGVVNGSFELERPFGVFPPTVHAVPGRPDLLAWSGEGELRAEPSSDSHRPLAVSARAPPRAVPLPDPLEEAADASSWAFASIAVAGSAFGGAGVWMVRRRARGQAPRFLLRRSAWEGARDDAEAEALWWSTRPIPFLAALVAARKYARAARESGPPEEFRFRHDYGVQLYRLRRWGESAAVLRALVLYDPSNEDARYHLARALARASPRRFLRARAEAIEELSMALRANPLLERRARRDPAFRSLRADASFRALFVDSAAGAR